MRIRPVFTAALVMALLGASACGHTFDASTLGVEATMASPASAPAQGEPFEINKKAMFFFWGAIRGSQPSLQDALASQVTSVERVSDVRVRVRSGFGDVLITILTVGLVVPRSVTYEGVVVGQ
jgi:hypothetical protein